jgi:phosphatidate cytidylyltransferase
MSDATNLRRRVKTWWVMASMFTFATVVGKGLSLIFFAFMSFLALKEYFTIIPTRHSDRRVLFLAYLSIPVQYYWISRGWYGMFIIFIPTYMFLLFPLRLTLTGETKGFLRAAGTIHWGLMITVYCLSHAAYLLMLPASGNPKGGGAALLLFLVFLTEINDVSQYIFGKLFGRRKIAPNVSPGKTLGGLLGGIAVTTILSIFLSRLMTPLTFPYSLIAGIIISIAGFFGDIVISSLKRDLGIKDSGKMLAGHGGILDRVDSLSYTAPLFFHFIRYYFY